ncbi:MAG: hypothetical protein SGI89_03585 [bacterium]|nr:hypothetical protein [bacterium]
MLAGCGEQIVSGNNSGTESVTGIDPGDKLSVPVFYTQLKLIPGQIFIFNSTNTGLIEMNEISFMNSLTHNSDIAITAYYEDEAISLDGNSEGFRAKIIMIENLRLNDITLDVLLKGVRN